MIRALSRANLLILDDWGPQPLTADQRRDLLEMVEDRYDKGSIIITSQLPVDRWYELTQCAEFSGNVHEGAERLS